MTKYYIINIDSLGEHFSKALSGKIIDFVWETDAAVFSKCSIGDRLLGVVNGCGSFIFEIESIVNDARIKVSKVLEIDNTIPLTEDVRFTTLTEISKFKFIENVEVMMQQLFCDEEFDFSYLFQLDNKPFALETFKILKENQLLNAKAVETLTNKEKCSQILKNSFSILREVKDDVDFDKIVKDNNGNQRYYSEKLNYLDTEYVITNNWYMSTESKPNYDTRTPYVNWIKEQFDKKNDVKPNRIPSKPALSKSRKEGGFNKIYYGIPGCGKSYAVDSFIKKTYPTKEQRNKNVFRTTFYLDYSNSDFVGQLVPKVEGDKVTYKPSFGPFAKALIRTYQTDEMVYLVIEELNRGNAAAIFGDLFQLLDRLDDKKVNERNDGSKVGDSEYPITNTFLEDYLGIDQGNILIPSNLTILATMNSSDQNVFPLDTAFKRRWKMEKVIDDYRTSKFANHYVPQKYSNSTQQELVTWKEFLEMINKFIISNEDGFNLEDKQLGSYFVTDSVLVENQLSPIDDDRIEQFNHKVLEYLWNDVAKFDRTRWVNKSKTGRNPRSFDELIVLIKQFGIKDTLEAFNDNPEGE